MRNLTLTLFAVVAVGLAGCRGSADGDVDTAAKATQAAPKTVDQLPADMPPEARASAAGAMAATQAQKEQMDAQAAAMRRMRASQPR